MDVSLSKLQEMVKDREACVLQSMGWQRVVHNIVTEQQEILWITSMELFIAVEIAGTFVNIL